MPDVHFLDNRRPVGDLAGQPQIPVICAVDLLEADGDWTRNPDEVTCRDCRDRIHEGQATCDDALCPVHGDQRDTNVDYPRTGTIKAYPVNNPTFAIGTQWWAAEVVCRHEITWRLFDLYSTELTALRAADAHRDGYVARWCSDQACEAEHRRANAPSAINAGPAHWSQGGRQ